MLMSIGTISQYMEIEPVFIKVISLLFMSIGNIKATIYMGL